MNLLHLNHKLALRYNHFLFKCGILLHCELFANIFVTLELPITLIAQWQTNKRYLKYMEINVRVLTINGSIGPTTYVHLIKQFSFDICFFYLTQVFIL